MGDGTGAGDGPRPREQDALDALRYNWGGAYMIGHDDERGWWAARRDRIGGMLTGHDPERLLEQIAADYALKPVPRDAGAEEATLP